MDNCFFQFLRPIKFMRNVHVGMKINKRQELFILGAGYFWMGLQGLM